MKIDIDSFDALIQGGYIRRVEHPERPGVYIFNYTPKTQFERVWNDQTCMARGLIADAGGNIIARPFPKFFNYEEHAPGELNWRDGFTVTTKLDGSLFILQPMDDGGAIYASRGSFESEQAQYGKQLILARYGHVAFMSGTTYLFELIYPENRIVVDYGETRDLILIGMYDVASGTELPLDAAPAGLRVVERHEFEGIAVDPEYLRQIATPNEEGFVVRFGDGLRVKIKFDDYKRLHKIVTGVSTRTIWEYLRDGKPIDELVDGVPDEFYRFVQETIATLILEFNRLEERARQLYGRVADMATRKEQAAVVLAAGDKVRGAIVFRMLDGMDYAPVIWRALEPEYKQPFSDRE